MNQTANLAIDHIATNQYQKEVTANTAFDLLDGAIAGKLDVALANVDVTLATSQALGTMVLRAYGAMTAACAVIVPINSKLYAVLHDGTGGFNVTVKTATGTGVSLAQGERALVYCDGTSVVQVLRAAPDAGTVVPIPFDVGCTFSGQPAASAVMLRVPLARAVTFPAGLAGSYGVAGIAPTAAATFSVCRNGVPFAAMTFAAAANTASFAATTATTFAAGDILSVVSPGTQDTTLADIGATLVGSR